MPSSAIRSHTYDPAGAALDVTFVTGRRYRYFLLPACIAQGLADAISKGRYFNARIRDRFPFEELEPEAETPEANLTSPGTGNRRRP
jgi:hypothetical protein